MVVHQHCSAKDENKSCLFMQLGEPGKSFIQPAHFKGKLFQGHNIWLVLNASIEKDRLSFCCSWLAIACRSTLTLELLQKSWEFCTRLKICPGSSSQPLASFLTGETKTWSTKLSAIFTSLWGTQLFRMAQSPLRASWTPSPILRITSTWQKAPAGQCRMLQLSCPSRLSLL